MANVNKAIIVGRLGADPDIRTFDNGGKIANLSIATSERWTDKITGEPREQTEWHRVVLHGKAVNLAEQYLRKGSEVYIEGSLHTRKWTDNQGIERYSTEIKSYSMQMCGNGQQQPQNSAYAPQGQYQAPQQGYPAPTAPQGYPAQSLPTQPQAQHQGQPRQLEGMSHSLYQPMPTTRNYCQQLETTTNNCQQLPTVADDNMPF